MPKPYLPRAAPADRPPLDEAGLRRLALDYLGRYATTRAKLEAYLRRKLRERGGPAALVPLIAARMADLGYLDDRSFGLQRAGALSRRGYGARRVAAALAAAGVCSADAAPALADARENAWDAALAFARRRGLGPFGAASADPAARRRAFAAMMRAGHPPDLAARVLALGEDEVELLNIG